jgi:hypothetical protein
MNARREAAELRDLARELLALEERARSLLCLGVSEDNEERLEQIARSLCVDADALTLAADVMDPAPFVPTLFQWARGKSVPVVMT